MKSAGRIKQAPLSAWKLQRLQRETFTSCFAWVSFLLKSVLPITYSREWRTSEVN